MTQELTIDVLTEASSGSAAAFRCRRTLQPAGGPGDKVFPPTYAGAVYAVEERRVRRDDGTEEVVPCVLLDSVQSQANRMEEALQEAVDAGVIHIPVIEVAFPDDQLLQPVGRVTSLQAPHRIADAILRDSLLNGTRFPESLEGQRLSRVGLQNATALYELCPTALVFGMWDSTGPRGGLGPKFQRVLVSEVVGVRASFGTKTSSRIDPLGVRLQAGPVYRATEGPIGWTLDEEAAAKEKGKPARIKDGKPSQVNHGNVTPSLSDIQRDTGRPLAGGVTVGHAEQTVVLSLAALRRLRFPAEDGKSNSKRDIAARTTLAALALCAGTLAMERGLDLRSRCLLWPDGPTEWELLDVPGKTPVRFGLDQKSAAALLAGAVSAAHKHGVTWRQSLQLQASQPLVELVRKSQQLAVQEAGEEALTA
jgi:CRISPR-associated protein Csb1